jgi:formylglycine-generating enzyme required for sulfatase activity/predicted Ser/Thr protein kinase
LLHTLAHDTLLWHDTYQIDYPLGKGGFGITYRAHHTRLEKILAIKEYYPQDYAIRNGVTGGLSIPTNVHEAYQKGKERFLNEGKILAGIEHPNIIKVLDYFEEKDTAYLVMDLIRGKSLKTHLEEQANHRLSVTEVQALMTQLVDALAIIHQKEIYHLDLSPDNLLLTPEGKLILIDFGAAKQIISKTISSKSHTTRAFKEGYAPPEVMSGNEVSAASDIFEVGMILYQLLTGTVPPSAITRLFNGDKWQPEAIPEPYLSLVKSALILTKENRPQNIKQWWQNLVIEEKPPNTPPFFTEKLPGNIDLEMVAIPEGEFIMGTEENEIKRLNKEYNNDWLDHEKPPHQVNIAPFYMGKYAITQAQWQAVAKLPKIQRDLELNPSNFKGSNRPVEQVSWLDAMEFCLRLAKHSGKAYRLPSEAEWEYACRAGTTTLYDFGNTINTNLANYWDTSDKDICLETKPVGSYYPNAFGLYDMHGNVYELCQDAWHDDYEDAPTDGSAWGNGGEDGLVVIRGGSFDYYEDRCYSAYRSKTHPKYRYHGTGFRVACSCGD